MRVAEPSMSPKLTAAEDAIDRKQYIEAEASLKQVVTENPKDFRAWFDLGYVYGATDRKQQAIEAYRNAVNANPKLFEANLNLGLMLAEADSPEAERFLSAATKLKPGHNEQQQLSRAWTALGHVLVPKEPNGALTAFAEASKLDAANAAPHLGASRVFMDTRDYVRAEPELRRALELDPKSAQAASDLAALYAATNRMTDAEAAARIVVSLAPTDPKSHLQLSSILLAQNKADEASAAADAALKLAPDDPDVQKKAAAAAIAAKQYTAAEQLLRRLLASDARNATLHHQLGMALMYQKRFPEAQRELLQSVTLQPDLADAYADLAIVAAENKQYVLALKALDARAKFLPDAPGTLFLRATAYDHLREPKLAAENYHRFLEIAGGKFPDQEWQARHRLKAIEPKK